MQVLRVYYDNRLHHRNITRKISETGREGIQSVLQKKRKRYPGVSSKHLAAADGSTSAEVPASLLHSDNQFDDTEQLFSNSGGYGFQLPRHYTTDDIDDQGGPEPESHDEDEEAQASIHKDLSSSKPPRRRKFSWTEEADR